MYRDDQWPTEERGAVIVGMLFVSKASTTLDPFLNHDKPYRTDVNPRGRFRSRSTLPVRGPERDLVPLRLARGHIFGRQACANNSRHFPEAAILPEPCRPQWRLESSPSKALAENRPSQISFRLHSMR